MKYTFISLYLHDVFALSLDLRLSHVPEMWIDLLWGYQTLHRERVAIKVAFRFVMKHAARHGLSRWNLPLSSWEREIFLCAPWVIGSRNAWPCYIRLIFNLVWDSDSEDRERVVSRRLNLISWGKGNGINIVMVRPIRSLCTFRSWHVLLEAATNYWSISCTRVMTKRAWTNRVTHLRLSKHNSDWIRVGLD